MKGVKNVIFDFGNVLFDLDVGQVKKRMESITGLGFDLYNQDMPEAFRLYETGQLSRQAFLVELEKITGRKIPEAFFLTAWNSMLAGMQADKIIILQKMKKKYQLSLLSNINEAHKEWIDHYFRTNEMDGFWGLFDHIFLSFEIGLRKPDPAIFTYVLQKLKSKPGETVMIDDGEMHLESAAKCGMQTIYMKPGTDLEKLLITNKLL